MAQLFVGVAMGSFCVRGSIVCVCVGMAGIVGIHSHRYPRCVWMIKNISRYNLPYLCLV